ncbi:MAG: hypothetical protein ACHQO8_10120 [Vicinamibacterales bacterium]
MRRVRLGLELAIVLVVAASCGSSSPSPAGPGNQSQAAAAPQNFRITLQRVFFTANEIQMAWSGSTSTYRLWVGTTSGSSDVLNVEVTGTSYTWEAPRTEASYYLRVFAVQGGGLSEPSNDQLAFTIDLRNVIDALFFHAGPMSDTPDNALTDPFDAVWQDGTKLLVQVTNEATPTSQANADIFVNDYAGLAGGAITATTQMISDDLHNSSSDLLPIFNIGVRVLNGYCPAAAIACANYGPAPLGTNRSMVTMQTSGGAVSVAHELGHSYGMGHVKVNSSVRPELNFLMNPALVSTQLTEPEKNAITAARDGGLRPGWRRSQALGAGLVLPYVPHTASGPGRLSISRGPFGPVRCSIVDGSR